MADTVYYNPTLGLQNITPALDDETFLFFLSAYYDWMQTTDITFNGASGAFSNGEIITGQDSRATATIRYVGSNTITVSMKTEIPFDLGEEFVGGTSANSAFVLELSDNVLRKASHLRENKNNEKAQGQFLEYLKGELNKGMPVKTSADRRKLIAQLKDFFKSKSTEEAYTFLFRALFNETIEIRYPGDDLLRVSDGNFLKQSTIRINERGAFQLGGEANVVSGNALVIGSNTDFTEFSTSDYFKIGTQQAIVSNVINATHMLATTNFTTTANNQFVFNLISTDIFQLKNKTIRGRTSGAVGVVSDIRASTLGGRSYADIILRLISGGFEENEIIEDIDNPSSNVIVYGVVSGITINDGGTGYAVDDDVIITGDGLEASAKVTSVSEAPISKIILANTGIGYQNNLNAVVNNTGTGGTGFAVRISEIANTYTVGANNQYTVGDTVTVRIVNRGSGYVAIPTITLQDTAVASLGLLHEKLIRLNDAGTLYEVGDPLVFTNPVGFTGNTAVGRVAAVTERWAETPAILVATEIVEPYKDESLLDDFGSNTVSVEGAGDEEVGILIEGSYYDRLKTEDWRAIGPIERLELSYANGIAAFGSGYTSTSLPTVVVTSANGIGANLEVFNIQGKSAVINIDASNNIAGIGSIREVTILNQGINYTNATVDATGSGDGNANLVPDISGLFVDSGRFTNDDGKVNFKILQDSLFYQDFSYVIRSGLSFDRYKDIVKEVVHPAGLEFFGEIVITSTISLTANFTSAIDADKAPRLTTLFSFLSLFEGIGFPPANQQSIVVRIKPFVSYTDQAKADVYGEINLEITPTVINAGASAESRFKPILTPFLDVGVFGGANVTVIPVSPGESEYDIILAGASVPATFDSAGAIREVNIEPIVINQIATVVESTDPGLKGPLQYALGPLSAVSQLASIKTIEIPLNLDVSTSFFDAIITMETGVKTLEIDVISYVDLAATIIPTANIATPKFYKTKLNLASNTQVEHTVDIESVFKRLVPLVYGDLTFDEYGNILILHYDNATFDDTLYPVGRTRNEYNIEVPSFVDVTMAFYSTIVTMETDIKSVEIDINLLLQAPVVLIGNPLEVEILIDGKQTYGDVPLSLYASDNISVHEGTRFGEIAPRSLVNANTPANFVEKQFTLYTATTSISTVLNVDVFYKPIIEKSIDVGLFGSTIVQAIPAATAPKSEIDIILNPDRYYQKTIEEFSELPIGMYDEEPFTDRIAWGRSTFETKHKRSKVTYGELDLFALADRPLTDLCQVITLEDGDKVLDFEETVFEIEGFFALEQGISFNDTYALDRTVTKNRKISGTVNVVGNTVIGTNTDFTSTFFTNDVVIIGSEKFTVQSISNLEYMVLNTNASTNYTNVSAYREYFV